MAIVGNFFSICGTIMVIFPGSFTLGYAEVCIGIGAFCTWSSITKYLSNTEDLYVINRTFQEAIPLLMKLWIGILPLYFGISFLSVVVMYGARDTFGSIASSMYVFFSMQCGDALFDEFTAMRKVHYYYANFIMYPFLFFIISVV